MGRKLLVADDSVTIQKVIKLALSSEGYDILAVSDGKEAIRAIQEERPDVVLIDITLPGADAYAVKRAINEKTELAATGFILLTSAFERVDEKLVDEVKFHGRLIKPFDPSHLRKAVADLMSKPKSEVLQKSAAPAPSPAPMPVSPPAPILRPATSITVDVPIDSHVESVTPAMGTTVATETRSIAQQIEDLPPMTDMHPTVDEMPAAKPMTEDEFHLNESTQPTFVPPERTDTDWIAPPPPPDEHTEPHFVVMPPTASMSASVPGEGENDETQELENDIKDLTESTIKMSGLDEFQWSLEDSKKMKAPQEALAGAKRPASAPSASDDAMGAEKTIEFVRPLSSPDKRAASIGSVVAAVGKTIDDGGSNFPMRAGKGEPKRTNPNLAAPTLRPPPGSDMVSGKDFIPTIELTGEVTNPGRPSHPMGGPISRAEIEEMIRKDVQAAIEKIAREAVPQITETMIRKELEKILAEP